MNLTDEQEAERDQYEAQWHVKRSKARGDYHALAAQQLTGLGDYREEDHGGRRGEY